MSALITAQRRWEARFGPAAAQDDPAGEPAREQLRLTPVAVLLLGAAGALVPAGLHGGQRSLIVVAGLVAAAVLASLLDRAPLRSLLVEVAGGTTRLTVGERRSLLLVLTNTGRRPLPRLGILLAEPPLGSGEGVLEPLPAGGRAELLLPWTAGQRGRTDHAHLTVVDPGAFGLVLRTRTVSVALPLLVQPTPVDAPPVLLHARSLGDDDATAGLATAAGSAPRPPRPWQSGDAARRVHWRASARAGELLVREWDPPRPVRAVLVVQVGAAPAIADPLLAAVAGVGSGLLAAGAEVTVITTGRACHGLGDVATDGPLMLRRSRCRGRSDLLDELTVPGVARLHLPALAREAARAVGPGDALLLALAPAAAGEPELADGIAVLRATGARIEVLLAGPDTPPELAGLRTTRVDA